MLSIDGVECFFQLMLRAIYGSEEQDARRPPWPRPAGDDHDHLDPPAGGLHLHDRPYLGGQGGDLADHVQDQGGVLQELHDEGRGGEETIAVKEEVSWGGTS